MGKQTKIVYLAKHLVIINHYRKNVLQNAIQINIQTILLQKFARIVMLLVQFVMEQQARIAYLAHLQNFYNPLQKNVLESVIKNNLLIQQLLQHAKNVIRHAALAQEHLKPIV